MPRIHSCFKKRRTTLTQKQRQSVQKLAILFPEALGDYLIFLPFMNRVKDVFPHAKIHVYSSKSIQLLLSNHRSVDRFILVNDVGLNHHPRTWNDLKQYSESLQKEKYDAVFFTHDPLFWYALYARIPLLLREKTAVQFRIFCFGSPHWLTARRYAHLSVRYMNNLDMYRGQWAKAEEYDYRLGIPDALTQTHPFKLPSSYVVINPDFHSCRNYDKAFYLQVVDYLLNTLHLSVVQVGLKDNYELARHFDHPHYVDLVAKTNLFELLAVMRGSSLFIGVDSGTAHLASALGIKALIVYPPKGTQPWQWCAYHADCHLYKFSTIKSRCEEHCSFFSSCDLGHCDKDYEMTDIFTRIESIIKSPPRSHIAKQREVFKISIAILVAQGDDQHDLGFWRSMETAGYNILYRPLAEIKKMKLKEFSELVKKNELRVLVLPQKGTPLKFRLYQHYCDLSEQRLFMNVTQDQFKDEDSFVALVTGHLSGHRPVI